MSARRNVERHRSAIGLMGIGDSAGARESVITPLDFNAILAPHHR